MAKKKRDKCSHCEGTGKVPAPGPFDVSWALNSETGFLALAHIEEKEVPVEGGLEVQPSLTISIESMYPEDRGSRWWALIREKEMDTITKAWKEAKRLNKPRRKPRAKSR